MKNNFREELLEQVIRCNKCGFCQSACRVYKTLKHEAFTARGRLRLIKRVMEGEGKVTPGYEKALNACLNCMECSATCPSGVEPARLILAGRQDLAQRKGLPFTKKVAITKVFPNQRALASSFAGLRITQKLIKQPIRGIDIAGMKVAKKSFLDSAPEVLKGNGAKARVGLYVGCMTNFTLPEVAWATAKVLNAAGCEVVIPKAQVCCGTPMYVYGAMEEAQEAARRNVEVFSKLDVDAIVTACSSCGCSLKHHFKEVLAEDQQIAEKASVVSAKSYDITEFLTGQLGWDPAGEGKLRGKVTYHDPCHLVRGQGISTEPRNLLKSVKGLDYVEMKEASTCCGAAGMFQFYYPEVAGEITQRKMDNIEASKADYVVTNCPACLHRLRGGLRLRGVEPKGMHIMEVLAQTL